MSLPPSARRVAALRDLVKQARDKEDSRRTAQRDKRARVGHQDVQEVSRNNSPDPLQPPDPDEPPHPDKPPDPPQPPDPDKPPHPDAPPDPPQPPDPDEPNQQGNLCAHRWLKQVESNKTTEEFCVYYGDLSADQRKEYDNEAAELVANNAWDKTVYEGTLH
ncbi:uncharacterized protein HD556DRAFT_1437645 [Suillus plorans]|uniref:Uncharacterized protein n=1 Tax=Suillus plorans TaxID=116603 RepID=A0A9P7DV79_9AGAM|nr:uncharacterized protein HD556DRAFT_1437645 [Suillus plorans]KAG1803911.1 hypothetical protein HD556DRAFT_1437645 [Suillus plorans]